MDLGILQGNMLCPDDFHTEKREHVPHTEEFFFKQKHDLHLFAQQVDTCIHTREAVEHAEIVANEVNKMSIKNC